MAGRLGRLLALAATTLVANAAAAAAPGPDWVAFPVFETMPVPGIRPAIDIGGCAGIWAARSDGSGLRRLVDGYAGPGWGAPLSVNASPDGTKLAIVRASDNERTRRIDVLDLTSGRLRSVARSRLVPLVLAFRTWWAPDGQTIAYVAPSETEAPLVLLDLATGSKRRLARGSFVAEAAFSPGGREIAIEEIDESSGAHPIRVHPLDGGAPREIASNGFTPSWAPDGSTIAYVGAAGEDAFELRVVAADGSGGRLLAPNVLTWLAAPAWTTDASEVVALRANGASSDEDGIVTAFSLAGATARRIVGPAVPVGLSDDGSRIVFQRERFVRGETVWTVHSARLDGSDRRLIGVSDEQDVNVGGIPTVIARTQAPRGPDPGAGHCRGRMQRTMGAAAR